MQNSDKKNKYKTYILVTFLVFVVFLYFWTIFKKLTLSSKDIRYKHNKMTSKTKKNKQINKY